MLYFKSILDLPATEDFPRNYSIYFKTSGDFNRVFEYPDGQELYHFDVWIVFSLHCSKVGLSKSTTKKTSSLLHKKLILGHPFAFFEVIACLLMILTLKLFIHVSLQTFQWACRVLKKCKDGGLSLSDEKLISWPRKYDLPSRMQLFEENLLFKFS